MANDKMILVTGATGATGSSAIEALLRLRIPVRAFVHQRDARSEQLRAQGVEIAQGDLSDFEAVSGALSGIAAAYFVYPIQVPGILEATAFFAQAALEQGVGAIVNMSQASARRTAKSHAARNHWIAERLLDRSGIPVTHLRPTLFAEWIMYLAGAIRDKKVLPLAFGHARYAPVAGEDLGRVIAAILKDPAQHAGKTYPLYGFNELSQYDIADMLTQVLGHKITYLPMEIEAFKNMLKEMGFTPHFQQHMGHVCQDCQDGIFSGTNDLVKKLSGQEPLGMLDFIVKNEARFRAPVTVGT